LLRNEHLCEFQGELEELISKTHESETGARVKFVTRIDLETNCDSESRRIDSFRYREVDPGGYLGGLLAWGRELSGLAELFT